MATPALPEVPEADIPVTLPQFARLFATDEACAAFLFKLRYPDGYKCPVCGVEKAWKVDPLYQMICVNNHRVSVTRGTIMHKTRTPLTTWFYAAYLVSTLKPGISALQFQEQLGLSRYETAFQLLHKLRHALVAPDREPLRGVVEVDEQFVGGKEEGRPGRGAETKALVVVGVEVIRWFEPGGARGQRGHERRSVGGDAPEPGVVDGKEGVWRTRAGRMRMTVIPDASGPTLLEWVARNIEKGSTVHTDGWSGYNGVAKLGYDHRRTLQTHKGEDTGEYLPMVHLIISNVKRWLIGTHKGAVQAHHLQAYLNEFVFRFNRRFWRGPAFLRALGLALISDEWPEYETLYAVREGGEYQHPNPRPGLTGAEAEAIMDALLAEAAPELAAWMATQRDALSRVVRREAQ